MTDDEPRHDASQGDPDEHGRREGDRPEDDRPADDQPAGDRPTSDRPEDDRPSGDRSADHDFSGGQGFGEPEGFDLDPPELQVDPERVDPVDSRVLTDELDARQLSAGDVDTEELLDVGLSYMRINRFEQATETFERVARFAEGPVEQEAWTNKGAAHARLEEYDAAIGAYEEALRIDDDSEHAASAETNLAHALWEAGRTEQALEHAERAVEIDPRFPQGWYNRGFFLFERGLDEDALNAFDNALRLGFRNAEILDQKAAALERLGEDERAEEVAAEADELRESAEREMMDDSQRA